MKRLDIRMEDDIFKGLRILAAMDEKSMNAYIVDLIKGEIKKLGEK